MKNVALITGASTGIGKQFAYIHAEKKGDLVLVARSKDKLDTLKAELEKKHGVEVLVIAKDLSLIDSPTEIFEELETKGIAVDYLINNAGFGGHGKFHERNWGEDEQMIMLNIMALTKLTRLFLTGMVKRNSGRVLNVSSTASLMPGPLQAVYFATKAFVTSFSNAIAEELSDTNISITALLPGATKTEFAATSGMDKTALFKNAYSARSVAEDGYNGMLKGKLDVISGVPFSMKMQLPLLPMMPKRMLMKMVRKMQEV